MSILPRMLAPEPPAPPQRPKTEELTTEERILYPATDDYPSTEEGFAIEEEAELPDTHEEPAAVRVYPVAAPPADRTIVTWSAGTLDVDQQDTFRVTQVAARNRGRKRLVVRNMSLDANVYLVPAQDTLYYLGFKLNAGQDVEILHNDDVWCYAEAGGNPATITYLAEYEVPESDTENG